MQRRTLGIAIAGAFVLAGLIGGTAALLASNDAPAAAPTSSTTTSTPAVDREKTKANFFAVLRDQGVVNGPADEQLAYAEGDLYCRYLAEGLTRQQLMDNAGVAGSEQRAKSERVLTAAVGTLCPEHAAKIMPPA